MKVPMNREARRLEADSLFVAAWRAHDAGERTRAFRLFRRAAKLGDRSAHLMVGYCFDVGDGVKASRRQAMSWYRKAVRRADASSAKNIGTIYRDEGRYALALRWFEKSVAMGNDDAWLDLGKLWAGVLDDRKRAARAFERVVASREVSEVSREDAQQSLAALR